MKQEIENVIDNIVRAVSICEDICDPDEFKGIDEAGVIAISALEKQLELQELGFSNEVLENYKLFENECISQGFTFTSLIEAREKQIPKKPNEEKCLHEDWEYCINCENAINCCLGSKCPICNNSLEYDCGEKDNYCPNCGQKLDWSMEDE